MKPGAYIFLRGGLIVGVCWCGSYWILVQRNLGLACVGAAGQVLICSEQGGAGSIRQLAVTSFSPCSPC